MLTLVSNEVELVQSQEIGSRLRADKLRKSNAVLVYKRNQIFASSDRHDKIGSNSFQHSTLRFNFYQVIYSSCTKKKKGDPLAKQTANASDGLLDSIQPPSTVKQFYAQLFSLESTEFGSDSV